MSENLPLLVFPDKRVLRPDPGIGFPAKPQRVPSHGAQALRIDRQIQRIEADFARYQATLTGALAGLEPEMVLVIEIVGRVEDFKQAIEAASLEWLGETELDELDAADDGFYELDESGHRVGKSPSGRMFLAMSNAAGLHELLSLWRKWKEGLGLPHGKTKWKAVFEQLSVVRRWGIEESLIETGMIDRWRDLVDPSQPEQSITFQVELFYRKDSAKRRRNEGVLTALFEGLGGRTLGAFLDMPDIAFHAVKGELPASSIERLLDKFDAPDAEIDIELFKFPSIMYFRPTGQSLALSEDLISHEPQPCHESGAPG